MDGDRIYPMPSGSKGVRPPFPKFLVHPDFKVFQPHPALLVQRNESGEEDWEEVQHAAHIMIYAMDDKKRDIYRQKAHVMVRQGSFMAAKSLSITNPICCSDAVTL